MTDYLPAVIVLSLLEYFLVILLFRYQNRCHQLYHRCPSTEPNHDGSVIEGNNVTLQEQHEEIAQQQPPSSSSSRSCFGTLPPLTFDHTFQSSIKTSHGQILLLCTRLVSFLYMGTISFYIYITNAAESWYYFTNWNIWLIAVYFALVIVCSILGLVYGTAPGTNMTNNPSVSWSVSMHHWARVIHVHFEICGGTAFFVTVVAFSMLDGRFTFWNASQHFVTSVTMLIELILNDMYVRMDHFPCNLSWAILYLVVIWPVVKTGIVEDWPYFFLDTSTIDALLFYTILLFVDGIFYTLWYLFSLGKLRICMYSSMTSTTTIIDDNNNINNEHQLSMGSIVHRPMDGGSSPSSIPRPPTEPEFTRNQLV